MYSNIGPVRRLFFLESCFWLANSSVLDYSGSSSLQKTWLLWNNKVIPRHKFFSLRGPPPLAFWLRLPFAIPKTTVHGKGFSGISCVSVFWDLAVRVCLHQLLSYTTLCFAINALFMGSLHTSAISSKMLPKSFLPSAILIEMSGNTDGRGKRCCKYPSMFLFIWNNLPVWVWRDLLQHFVDLPYGLSLLKVCRSYFFLMVHVSLRERNSSLLTCCLQVLGLLETEKPTPSVLSWPALQNVVN